MLKKNGEKVSTAKKKRDLLERIDTEAKNFIILAIPEVSNIAPQEGVNIILAKVIPENLRETFSSTRLDIPRFSGLG